MGNGKVVVRGVFLVMALLIPVMVQAQGGPPAGVGNDTNAGTLCASGQYLDGDGTCKEVSTITPDTNARTQCPNGHALLGDGTCIDVVALQGQLNVLAAWLEVDLDCLNDPPTSGDFVDNCDGTITDTARGLMWEKKTEANVNDTFTWSTVLPPGDFDGTAADYINALNIKPCFAGHCDWRLPKVDKDADLGNPELETILLAVCPGGVVPCIDSIFGPTSYWYWSATLYDLNPTIAAWQVSFSDGDMLAWNKTIVGVGHIRAVRSVP
jgi:hypothetical protein